MRKKSLLILAAAAFFAAVFYLSAPTALAAAPLNVYVGGTVVTTGYETETALPDGTGRATGTVQYTSGTLTLNGVTVPNTDPHNNAAIYADGDITIELVGISTVTGPNVEANSYGVYTDGRLTINGSGTLSATGGDVSGDSCSYGVYTDGDLSVSSGTLKGVGGHSAGSSSYGVLAFGNARVEGGSLEGTGGSTVTASRTSCGISAEGSLNVTSGTVSGLGGSSDNSYGVSVFEKLFVSGGSVTGGSVEGATVKAIGCGVNAGNGIKVTSTGVVSGTGGDMHSDRTDNTEIKSYGVDASTTGGGTALDVSGSGAVIGIGGNVTSRSEEEDAKNTSCGVYAMGGDVNVSGGTLSGTGGDITNEAVGNLNCGVYSQFALAVTGGTVFGEGGATTATDDKKISRGVRTESALTVSGGSLEGTGGTADHADSRGVVATGELSISGGSLKGTGGAGGTASTNGSIGVEADDNISISSGSLTGVGNNSAFNKQPHSLPSAGYFHRSSNTTTPPSNFTRSTTAAYVWNAEQKYAEIRDNEMPAVALTGGSATFPVGKASADAVFTIGANIGTFDVATNYLCTEVDGATLSSPDVEVTDGSIKLTFKRDYLNSLSAGTHTATVYLQGGGYAGATVSMQLVATAAPSPAPSSPGRANPSTGV